MATKRSHTSITFRLPTELAGALQSTAAQWGRGVSEEMRLAVGSHLLVQAETLLEARALEAVVDGLAQGDDREAALADVRERKARHVQEAFGPRLPSVVLPHQN